MRSLHLFAGAGGGLLADLILGHTPIGAVEIDPYCCDVLRQRRDDGWFPGLRVHEQDIRLFDPSEYAGRVDLIAGGFPCQDISAAGKGAGITGERSGLWKEFARIIGDVRPRFVFVENSPMLTLRGLNVVLADLAALGMDAVWEVVSAAQAGAPHRRERIWILAYSDGLRLEEHELFQSNLSSGSSQVANDNSLRQLQPQGRECDQRGRAGDGGLPVRHAHGAGLEIGQGQPGDDGAEQPAAIGTSWWQSEPGLGRLADELPPELVSGWWDIEPDVGRVAAGVKNRVGKLKALGNAQVPLQCALAWRILSDAIPR